MTTPTREEFDTSIEIMDSYDDSMVDHGSRETARAYADALEQELRAAQIEALRWERIDALGSLSYWYLQLTKAAKEHAAAWESRLAELDEALKALSA